MSFKTLAGFEIFPWNKNFETGIRQIDSQHKQLVRILNQLAFYLGHRANEADLNTVFNELADYADFHFKSEELIWKEYLEDDVSYKAHLNTHQSFIDEVFKLKEEEANLPIDVVIGNILKFLSRWLAIHILNTDTVMAKTVLFLQAGFSLEEAKENANNEMTGEKAVLIEAILQMYEQLSSRTLALMREKTGYLALQKGIVNEPDVFCMLDEALRFISWNQNFLSAMGVTSEALVGQLFLDLVLVEDQPQVNIKTEDFMDGKSVHFDCRIKGLDEDIYYHFSTEILLSQEKKTVLLSAVKVS